MKKDKSIWLQQDNEHNDNYELFTRFLDSSKTINEFAQNQIMYEKSTVMKCATNHKWRSRKLAYLQHNQNIKQKAIDKHTEKGIAKAMLSFENVCVKLTENLVNDIETKIKNNSLVIPDGSEITYLKNLVITLEKLIDCKDKLQTDKDGVLKLEIIKTGLENEHSVNYD
jgi:hypothetical protein